MTDKQMDSLMSGAYRIVPRKPEFEVDEVVEFTSPFTGDSVDVSYRGMDSDGNAMVWTGHIHISCAMKWLKHKEVKQ